MNDSAGASLPERPSYLVLLAAAPAVWMLQFLVSYVVVAMWCTRFAGRETSLEGARIAVAMVTVAALVAIALIGRGGYRRHRHGSETLPHDMDTPEDRHRFLGFATLLLAGLSAVAVIYVALPVVFLADCR
jgi:hypothetical protein